MTTPSAWLIPRDISMEAGATERFPYEVHPPEWWEYKPVYWAMDIGLKVICFEVGACLGLFVIPMVIDSFSRWLGFEGGGYYN